MPQESRTQAVNTVIRPGDRFEDRTGNVWKVIETKPGGKIELFDKGRSYFTMRYHREMRAWLTDGSWHRVEAR